MRNAYIKFATREDGIVGFYELIAHSEVTCLTNEIYCIPWSSLAILDERQINYTFATEDALTNASPVWNVADSKIKIRT